MVKWIAVGLSWFLGWWLIFLLASVPAQWLMPSNLLNSGVISQVQGTPWSGSAQLKPASWLKAPPEQLAMGQGSLQWHFSPMALLSLSLGWQVTMTPMTTTTSLLPPLEMRIRLDTGHMELAIDHWQGDGSALASWLGQTQWTELGGQIQLQSVTLHKKGWEKGWRDVSHMGHVHWRDGNVMGEALPRLTLDLSPTAVALSGVEAPDDAWLYGISAHGKPQQDWNLTATAWVRWGGRWHSEGQLSTPSKTYPSWVYVLGTPAGTTFSFVRDGHW